MPIVRVGPDRLLDQRGGRGARAATEVDGDGRVGGRVTDEEAAGRRPEGGVEQPQALGGQVGVAEGVGGGVGRPCCHHPAVPEILEIEFYRLHAEEALGRTVAEVHADDAWYLKEGLDAPTAAGRR